MSRNLHPTEGARYLLERTAEHGARADYRASIYTPDAVFTTGATLTEDGAAELGDGLAAGGAPAELIERLAIMARLIARDAPKRRADGLVVWPARVLRWRK